MIFINIYFSQRRRGSSSFFQEKKTTGQITIYREQTDNKAEDLFDEIDEVKTFYQR